MQPAQFDPGFAAFGGGATDSVLHPVVVVTVVIVTALMFVLPRKYVMVPLLLGILVIPGGQNLYLGGVHLYVYRILILIGWMRLLSSRPPSGKYLPGGLSTLDKLFLVWAFYRAMSVIVLFAQVGAAVNQGAFLLDSLGGYFLFRSLVRDEKDVRRVVVVYAGVALVAAVVMVTELATGKNMLGLMGGIRLISEVRNGRIRAQGVFSHSIIAGSFGAAAFPLFLWLWRGGKARVAAVIGAISSTIMVFASASSTPVAAWFGGILVACFWPLRKKMKMVRWGIVLGLVALQMVMKAPIWYLMARIDLAGGSSGWNRAFLIDMFTRHVGDWWLIGTHDNVNWGWDMWDQCNQFVAEGETGGLVALGCFIAMITICFKKIGKARKAVEGNPKKEWGYWFLGAAMFAQLMAFMGVNYFDQSRFCWYVLVTIIPMATVVPRALATKQRSKIAPLADPVSEPAPDDSVSTMPVPEVSQAMTLQPSSTAAAPRRWFD